MKPQQRFKVVIQLTPEAGKTLAVQKGGQLVWEDVLTVNQITGCFELLLKDDEKVLIPVERVVWLHAKPQKAE